MEIRKLIELIIQGISQSTSMSFEVWIDEVHARLRNPFRHPSIIFDLAFIDVRGMNLEQGKEIIEKFFQLMEIWRRRPSKCWEKR